MPDAAKTTTTTTSTTTDAPAQTFQQTAPEGEAPITGREETNRALNAPGAAPADTGTVREVTGTATMPGDDRLAEVRAADAGTELSPENVQGKAVTARMPNGDEVSFPSEEEARAAGGEVLGFTDGEPFVASQPAYLTRGKG